MRKYSKIDTSYSSFPISKLFGNLLKLNNRISKFKSRDLQLKYNNLKMRSKEINQLNKKIWNKGRKNNKYRKAKT